MPPQAEALPAGAARRGAPGHAAALPPPHQGLPDPHGPQPQGRQEAGQLLQRHATMLSKFAVSTAYSNLVLSLNSM